VPTIRTGGLRPRVRLKRPVDTLEFKHTLGPNSLDRWLPEFDVHERHQRELPIPPERAVELALDLPAAPDPLVRVLLRLRGLQTDSRIGEFFTRQGFEPLERTATTFVVGVVSTPWRPRGGLGRFDDPRPGTVRIVADFRAEPRPEGGSVLSTETRVAAVDDEARRAFRRYWLVIGPFSKLIRRRWLAAVARRAAA
jgi:hypothetical protein